MNYLIMNFRITKSFRGTNLKFVNGGIRVLDTSRKMFLRNFLGGCSFDERRKMRIILKSIVTKYVVRMLNALG
jgi:hypothetical protein